MSTTPFKKVFLTIWLGSSEGSCITRTWEMSDWPLMVNSFIEEMNFTKIETPFFPPPFSQVFNFPINKTYFFDFRCIDLDFDLQRSTVRVSTSVDSFRLGRTNKPEKRDGCYDLKVTELLKKEFWKLGYGEH